MPLHQIVPAAFLPTVVVGIGEEGKAACEQFTRLLGGLDEVRRACVAVLALEEGEQDSDGEIVGSWFESPPTSNPPGPEKKPLADLLVEAILGTPQGVNNNAQPGRLGVRDAQAILRISNNGYAVPDTMMAVVWVVAPTASAWLEPVVEKLRSSLSSIEQQRQQSRSWIMLALLSRNPKGGQKARDQQRAASAAQPWDTFLVGGKTEEPLATFAYLFEIRDEKNDFWQNVNDLPFAAAEAIFLFTASGMGTMNEFKASLRITSEARPVTRAPARMGSLGSTRLQFPRTEAELFCAYRLGSKLMKDWIPKQNAQLQPDESQEQEASAVGFITKLQQNIDDADDLPRGGPGGRPSPRLSDTVVAQTKGLPEPLRGDNEHIFHLMQRKEVEALVGGKRDLADQMAVQFERAKDELKQWKNWIRRQ